MTAPDGALTFTVAGQPVGQGQISGGGTHTDHAGRIVRKRAYHSNGAKLRPWRRVVAGEARLAMGRTGWATVPKPAPLELAVTFYVPRPPSVRPARRPLPSVGGKDTADLSHLVRALEDALTEAGVWEDDAQVTDYATTRKRYCSPAVPLPCAVVTVRPLSPSEIADALAEERTA